MADGATVISADGNERPSDKDRATNFTLMAGSVLWQVGVILILSFRWEALPGQALAGLILVLSSVVFGAASLALLFQPWIANLWCLLAAALNGLLLLIVFAFIHLAYWHEHLPGTERWIGDALYFSAVTFTTLGYGDLQPEGFGRVFAALEAFCGYLFLGVIVVAAIDTMNDRSEPQREFQDIRADFRAFRKQFARRASPIARAVAIQVDDTMRHSLGTVYKMLNLTIKKNKPDDTEKHS